jgi:hypothetical protein
MTDPSKSTKMKMQPEAVTKAAVKRIRVRSEDSAFVYSILEASGGVCVYSTLPHRPGDRHRDLELLIPHGQGAEVDRILADLNIQLAGEVYVLSTENPINENGSPSGSDR